MAIARAIVTDPALLLADEPTGALDSRSTADILALFDGFNADGRTVIVITHEADVAAHARRVIRMRDGKIISEGRVAAPTDPPPLWSVGKNAIGGPPVDSRPASTDGPARRPPIRDEVATART